VFSANVAEAESQSIGKLPVLYGPSGSQAEVVKRYFSLNEQLGQLNLRVAELRLSDRFAWTAVLDNGLRVEFGVERVERPMQAQLALFLKSYPVVMAQMMKKLAVFDLRYSSGFALAASSR
jgi:cell division protein FtsQ